MSGKNHEGNKSPDICDGNDQWRFLCSRTMKHRAMKGYEAQVSALERSKEGRTLKCSKADKAVAKSNIQRGEDTKCSKADKAVTKSNVQRGETLKCPKADRAVAGNQCSKEGRTPKCPKADKAVAKSNVQIGEDTEMSKG
jgi:hypothetical protein